MISSLRGEKKSVAGVTSLRGRYCLLWLFSKEMLGLVLRRVGNILHHIPLHYKLSFVFSPRLSSLTLAPKLLFVRQTRCKKYPESRFHLLLSMAEECVYNLNTV